MDNVAARPRAGKVSQPLSSARRREATSADDTSNTIPRERGEERHFHGTYARLPIDERLPSSGTSLNGDAGSPRAPIALLPRHVALQGSIIYPLL